MLAVEKLRLMNSSGLPLDIVNVQVNALLQPSWVGRFELCLQIWQVLLVRWVRLIDIGTILTFSAPRRWLVW